MRSKHDAKQPQIEIRRRMKALKPRPDEHKRIRTPERPAVILILTQQHCEQLQERHARCEVRRLLKHQHEPHGLKGGAKDGQARRVCSFH